MMVDTKNQMVLGVNNRYPSDTPGAAVSVIDGDNIYGMDLDWLTTVKKDLSRGGQSS